MENYGFMLGIGETEEADLIKIAADTANLVNEQRKRLDRAIELYELERQGRLVVLPCKVGDTVYDTYLGEVKVKTVVSIALLVSESVNCVTVSAANERGAITQLENWRFGKTVFLTCEEAEKSLKEDAG